MRLAVKRPAGRRSTIVYISFTSVSFSFEEALKNFCSPPNDFSAAAHRATDYLISVIASGAGDAKHHYFSLPAGWRSTRDQESSQKEDPRS